MLEQHLATVADGEVTASPLPSPIWALICSVMNGPVPPVSQKESRLRQRLSLAGEFSPLSEPLSLHQRNDESTRKARKQILASHASVPASTTKPSAPATIAISRITNA